MRKINRAVKIRIYPNAEQRVQIEKTIGCSRFIYNYMLADKMEHYKKDVKEHTSQLQERISLAERGGFIGVSKCTDASGKRIP
ncbi:helix-turn-helix domain-containing protein [Holdemanella biformis]|uniref:helix-turn-helix domain-containing protein n=1 Tax=Holdemanella biformis TaxID=1735 RepID=UPI003A8D154C